MKYSATTNGFYDPGLQYFDLPDDLVDITPDRHAELMEGQLLGKEIKPGENGLPQFADPPTQEEILAMRRASASTDRETLCRALHSQGKLSDESAIDATAGRWPVEFDAVTQGMTPAQVLDAKISWAGANTVRYGNPVLQAAALAFCQGNAAAATALLDQLFGIA